MLGTLYNSIIFQPLFNLLIIFYNFLGRDFGLAVIAITLVVRLILYPSFKHQLEAQKKMSAMQPKLEEIKARHKDDKEAQNRATMDFYKENKLNPFSSCLPMVVQLVILIALYQVFIKGLNGQAVASLYNFVPKPDQINSLSMGFLDITKPFIPLAVITGIIQFVQSKMMLPPQATPKPGVKDDFGSNMSSMMSKQMLYLFPILTVFIGIRLPAGLTLYWLVSTLFSILQQYIIMKGKTNSTSTAVAVKP